jgi:hypothetical protein
MEPIGKLAKSTAHDKLNQPLFREAPMSLELAAQHLASRGRKGDTMLVHMAPQEVSGLQALARAHGGTLTVNPDTGLPEANFLKRMLPMLIGAALTPLTGGLINPMTAGLLIGGVETARTGDLGKGLMAGLGAYGGAGLGAGLMGAGAGTAGATASALGVPGAATGAGSQAAMLAAQNQGFGQAGLEALGSSAGVAQGAAPVVQSGMQSLGAGVQGLGTEAGRNAALSSMGGGMQAAKYGLAALGPMMMQGDSQAPFAGSGPNPYEYDYDPNTQRYTRVPPGTRQRDILAPTTQMAAAGGPIEEMSDRNQMETIMANGGQMFAAGGISNLGDYSDGGRLLKGPGDGVSDSIPATIADKRPARLADGEFVVPARIVSELGNGSTEAGARKLYAMMDRVQKARGKTTGKNRVAINSRTEKLLPA